LTPHEFKTKTATKTGHLAEVGLEAVDHIDIGTSPSSTITSIDMTMGITATRTIQFSSVSTPIRTATIQKSTSMSTRQTCTITTSTRRAATASGRAAGAHVLAVADCGITTFMNGGSRVPLDHPSRRSTIGT